ncbi:hypothetical protein [Jejuia pallidilutea]|jgi:hypothetical protein|uniref:Uncharacterized protein n=1 Tax=Jejuia pallidilutea TaxID=504487 RepID=A0A090W2Z2_9FLAO|nr:hypothetical protein [Jejuia pallidilutea]GAL66036.1 hypothetical protein JCM19301_601 [Jejuia pallidilutea]GAL70563.1 hypothetical protein JCM19302_1472 [Jejuia pallidilutea]GAL88088.1 hypothetical protein JCM19538_2451 [Jejuia pallidilutea]
MKYVAYTIIILALGLGIFNATKLNFNALFQGESIIGLITILASLCAIILMLILLTSKRIEEKVKQKK